MTSINNILIALDLDGTLLNSEGKISNNTKTYLKDLSKKGAKIIFASGRAKRALINFYDELELHTPIICYNGAKVFSPKDINFTAEHNYFDKDMIKNIVNHLLSLGIIESFMSEIDDEMWVDVNDEFLYKFFIKDNMNIHVGNVNDILNKDPITFIAKFKDTPENRKIIEEYVSKYDDIGVRFWDRDIYFELYYKHVDKYHSIRRIAQYYNIDDENIYAFGDADNDIEVMKNLKNGIAMKNSSKLLKSIAKNITEFDNDHDGIIIWLDNNLFKNN